MTIRTLYFILTMVLSFSVFAESTTYAVDINSEQPTQQLAQNIELLDTPPTNFLANLYQQDDVQFLEKTECCKVCRKGKACGDSCISKTKTCNVGAGCACDG